MPSGPVCPGDDRSLAHRITGPRPGVKKGDAALRQESNRLFSQPGVIPSSLQDRLQDCFSVPDCHHEVDRLSVFLPEFYDGIAQTLSERVVGKRHGRLVLPALGLNILNIKLPDSILGQRVLLSRRRCFVARGRGRSTRRCNGFGRPRGCRDSRASRLGPRRRGRKRAD